MKNLPNFLLVSESFEIWLKWTTLTNGFFGRVLPEDVRLTLRNDDSITCAEDLAIKADQLLQSKQFQPTSINFVSNRTNKFPSRVKKLCYFHEKDGKDSKRCAGTPIEKCSMWYLVNPSSERKRQAVERVTVLSASISNPQSGTTLWSMALWWILGPRSLWFPNLFQTKFLSTNLSLYYQQQMAVQLRLLVIARFLP